MRLPDLGAIGTGLYEHDVDPERLKLIGNRLGPSFERPFRGAIDRIGGLTHEGSLARNDNDPAAPLLPKSRQQRSRQLNDTKKFVSITRRSSASGTSSMAPAAATPALCTTASSLLPVRDSIVSVAARIEAPLATSSCIDLDDILHACIPQRLVEQARLFRSRIVANTRQPRLARATAVARPMPLDVPVINTDRIRFLFSQDMLTRGLTRGLIPATMLDLIYIYFPAAMPSS